MAAALSHASCLLYLSQRCPAQAAGAAGSEHGKHAASPPALSPFSVAAAQAKWLKLPAAGPPPLQRTKSV